MTGNNGDEGNDPKTELFYLAFFSGQTGTIPVLLLTAKETLKPSLRKLDPLSDRLFKGFTRLRPEAAGAERSPLSDE